MNQMTIQISDALAEEHTAYEASMKKVMSVHEEGDALSAVVTETTDELERAQKDQDRLQDELDCSCEDMANVAGEFSDCWPHNRQQQPQQLQQVSEQAAHFESSAHAEQPMKQYVSMQGRRGKEHTI